MPGDDERILRARAGDERALEDLIRQYQQPVAGFIAVRVTDRQAIPDLCQSAFVKMVLSIGKLQSADAFEPWLFRIAENVCRDFLRRERWRRRLFVALKQEQEMLGAVPAAEASPLDSQIAALRLGLDQIDVRQRKLLALSMEPSREQPGERPRSYRELAELTHLSVPAVKSRLFRARATLRRLVGRGETDNEP